jgi:hypothetical protein
LYVSVGFDNNGDSIDVLNNLYLDIPSPDMFKVGSTISLRLRIYKDYSKYANTEEYIDMKIKVVDAPISLASANNEFNISNKDVQYFNVFAQTIGESEENTIDKSKLITIAPLAYSIKNADDVKRSLDTAYLQIPEVDLETVSGIASIETPTIPLTNFIVWDSQNAKKNGAVEKSMTWCSDGQISIGLQKVGERQLRIYVRGFLNWDNYTENYDGLYESSALLISGGINENTKEPLISEPYMFNLTESTFIYGKPSDIVSDNFMMNLLDNDGNVITDINKLYGMGSYVIGDLTKNYVKYAGPSCSIVKIAYINAPAPTV